MITIFAKINSLGVYGINGFSVSVEADISGGLPQLTIVGLPDNAVKEACERMRSALKNLGFTFPVSRITINLAPADIKKTGPVYDLPVLLAVLAASEQMKSPESDCAFFGELSLDGEVRPINGALCMAAQAKENGIKKLFVPIDNVYEVSGVDDIIIYPVATAKDAVLHINGEKLITPSVCASFDNSSQTVYEDFCDVRGQAQAKRAIEIAAAGRHNLLMVGAPGSGKSMLAKRIPGILPVLTREEAIETTKIHSVAGTLKRNNGLMQERPFRSPHHSTSAVSLAGGTSSLRPGEVSLAHNGVLFLDELPEFRRDTLEILRGPIEDGVITISRAAGTATFPCNIMLIAAMNPCPCGFFGHPTHACSCNQFTIDRYLQRISGPLLDRIDLHVEVNPVEYDDMSSLQDAECSADIAKRVLKARLIQAERYAGQSFNYNANLPSAILREVCRLAPDAQRIFKAAFERMGLSARAYDRILKVSRTIADLDGEKDILAQHISEAIQYRNMDTKYWSK